jgi:predicted nucleic acid-binding protein
LILVDSSVWISHLRQPDRALEQLLDNAQVLIHPLVIGELSVGNLPKRLEILAYLDDLPKAVVASDSEVRGLVERERLFGIGVGYVDAHLLAATCLTPGSALWTMDGRLADTASRLGLSPP